MLAAAGNAAKAVTAYRIALSIERANAGILNNLGNALAQLGEHDQAIVAYCDALAARPDLVEALANLGNVLRDLARPDEAEACLRQALEAAPAFAEASNNLGCLLEDRGDFDQAESAFRSAIGSKARFTEPYVNLGSMLISLGRLDDASEALDRGLHSDSPDRWRMAALGLVVLWLQGRCDEAQVLHDAYREAARSASPSRNSRRQQVFFDYVGSLLEQRSSNAGAQDRADVMLAVIGDSHCLGPANLSFPWAGSRVVARSRLVTGIKMFHLGGTSGGRFAACLAAQLKGIEDASHLLFTIGEIDCRPDEGIWSHHRKAGDPLAQIVASTVDGYLDGIAAILGGQGFRSVTIQGIPAPAARPLRQWGADDRAPFLAMVHGAECAAACRRGGTGIRVSRRLRRHGSH